MDKIKDTEIKNAVYIPFTEENLKLKIKVKYHDPELIKLEQIDIGNWIDLRCAETVTLKAGEYKLLSLGISMELPEGYEALVSPRSSTYKNFKIVQANSLGIIDSTYNGNNDIWRFPAIAFEDTIIYKNDRICQFRIIQSQPKIDFIEVNSLGNKDRGGIGSTGIK